MCNMLLCISLTSVWWITIVSILLLAFSTCTLSNFSMHTLVASYSPVCDTSHVNTHPQHIYCVCVHICTWCTYVKIICVLCTVSSYTWMTYLNSMTTYIVCIYKYIPNRCLIITTQKVLF